MSTPSTTFMDPLDSDSTEILGANPFVGLSPRQVVAALGRVLLRYGLQPRLVLRHTGRLSRDLAAVALGKTVVKPKPTDKRWSDAAWQDHPAYRRSQQSYLVCCDAVDRAIDELGLDPKSQVRGAFAAHLVIEALAPTNRITNPVVLKRAFDTAGRSLLGGAKRFVSDVRYNGGMPSTVDRSPFRLGETVAVSPGAVVYRNDVLELIQYAPTTGEVHEVPVLYVPAQINKYYVLDMAPGRSFIEHAVAGGVQVFAVSWRNPGRHETHWDMDTYVGALDDALRVLEEITGSPQAHLLAVCAGGMTTSALLGHLAHTGQADRVTATTMLVTMLDTSAPSQLATFASRRSIDAAVSKARKHGVHAGSDMGRTFAWLRPNDLVWNYAISGWLMGQDPPAFDVLAWNADVTELPASLYEQFLAMYDDNQLRKPGALTVLGSPIDLSQVKVDAYVLGGLTDHIVGWQTCYQATEVLGGSVDFVLFGSGHIQSLVCPPGNPRARYFVDGDTNGSADNWRKTAHAAKGTWWDHWVAWTGKRAGELRPAPEGLGSSLHPQLTPAPGSYVHGSSKGR